jgi:hypothetical protein
MAWDWQQVVALACVVGAVFLLFRRARRLWNGAPGGGCGSGCSSCSAKDTLSQLERKPLVTLDLRRPEKPGDLPDR